MHNETKVNTNNPKSSPVDEKNVVPDTTAYVGNIEVPYGRLYIGRRGAEDHLLLRANQLTALTMLIHGDGLSHFQSINDDYQHSILWLTHQLASEIEATIPLLVADLKGAKP